MTIESLLCFLDEAFNQRSWHGTNLRGSLRGLSFHQAAWRPAPGRHNIWEIAVHAAYWKYAVRRRITGEKRGSFPLKGSNWFPRPVELSASAWKNDIALLEHEHQALRAAVAVLKARSAFHGKRWEQILWGIRGVAAHDLYHAGQIQLLKRLNRRR